MRRWPNKEAMVRYYQAEGFEVGDATCCNCGFKWVATLLPQTVSYKLDCPQCHWKAPGIMQSNNHFVPCAPLSRQ